MPDLILAAYSSRASSVASNSRISQSLPNDSLKVYPPLLSYDDGEELITSPALFSIHAKNLKQLKQSNTISSLNLKELEGKINDSSIDIFGNEEKVLLDKKE